MDYRPLTRQHPLDRTITDDAIIDNTKTTLAQQQANSHYIPHASTRISNQDFHTTTNNIMVPGQSLKHDLQPTNSRPLNNNNEDNQSSWRNGYNGGSLDRPGMKFYDSNMKPSISMAPNIGDDINLNQVPLSSFPLQPSTSLLYHSNNINSTPTRQTSSQILQPINHSTNILPPTNNAIVTQTTSYNIPLIQATPLRQLPSMSTLMGNKSSGRLDTTETSVDCIPTPDANSQIPTYRRSLPPMTHITGTNNISQLYNTNTQRNSIKNYSHGHIYPPLTSDSITKQTSNTTNMRQLPIITPYGPKPIHRPVHRPPLRDINQIAALQLRPQPRPRISIQPSPIHVQQGSNFPYITAPSTNERKLPQEIGQNSKKSYPAEFQQQTSHHLPSPMSANSQSSLANNRLNTQATINNASQRQLPIITKQGVLRLRDNSSFIDSENILPQTRKRPTKPYNVRNAIITTNSSSNVDDVNKFDASIHDVGHVDSKQIRLSNLTDSDNSYYDDDYEQQEDADTGEDDRVSDDSIGESEELVSSVKSEKEMGDAEMDNEDEIEDDDYNEVTVTEPDQENINIYINGDEFLEEDETHFDEPKAIEEVDEEAEYFSALATVQEEEGKLSDKDNVDYDQQLEEGDEPSVRDQEDLSVKSNETISIGNNTKLPTIAENGFEAQVLEYIVERTGLRRGELFSVDEEPSSFNDDADSGSMESRPDNGRQESLNISDAHLPMLNDNSYQVKNDDSVKDNFINQRIGQNGEPEPKSLQNDSMIHKSVGDFVGGEKSKFNRYSQQQFDLNCDSSISDGKKADYCDYDDTKQNLVDFSDVNLSATIFENNETPETSRKNRIIEDNKIDNLNTGFISTQEHVDGQTMIVSNGQQQFYVDQKILGYDLGEEGEEEEEDERILMSPNNNKTSFEQEEYDEQYRDINNLEDLDRRATNHVHAIDGHSKSMLNDIHQQRTIIDYYDENDFAMNNNNDCSNYNDDNNILELKGPYDPQQEDNNNNNNMTAYSKQDFEDQQIASDDYVNDTALRRDSKDQDKEEAQKKEDEEGGIEDDFDPNLPRARVRWITAVNKIVNRFGEVSYIFEMRLD